MSRVRGKVPPLVMFVVTAFIASISYGQGQLVGPFSFNSSAGTAIGAPTDTGLLPTPQALADLPLNDFSISFSFDESLVNLSPLPSVGAFSPLASVTVNVDGNVFTASDAGEIIIRNGGPSGEDSLTLFFDEEDFSGPAIGDFDTVRFSLLLEDTTGNAFTSVALPTFQLDAADFTLAIAGLQFSDSTNPDNSGGSIAFNLRGPAIPPSTALVASLFGSTVVPEPTSAALIALAGLSFGTCRQRRAV